MRKPKKIHYDVSVHLSDDATFFRLKFWRKKTRTYLKEFERRCNATSYEAAKVERDAEQLIEKWKNYDAETLKIVQGDFISLMREIANAIQYEPTQKVYLSNLASFQEYLKSDTLPFNKVTQQLVENFREWCLKNYPSQSTASSKYGFFCQGLKKADRENKIAKIYFKRIPLKPLKKKELLSEDDLNKLLALDYEAPDGRNYRKAFLFESLTGVSYIDLKHLEWKQITNKTIKVKGKLSKVTQLIYERWKTKVEVTIILKPQVLALLGERKGETDKVFPFITNNGTYNDHILAYIKEAGIPKYITSHCGRATAIVRIIESEDIYGAMKQVGHKKIETTLQYAQFTNKMMLGNANALTQGLKFNQAS